MDLFVSILTEVTAPVIVLMGVGFILNKRLKLHLPSLNAFLIQASLPAFMVYAFANSKVSFGDIGFVVWYTVAQFFVLAAIGWGAGLLFRVPRHALGFLALVAAFPNSGNFAIPLVGLAFGKSVQIHQVMIMTTHAVLIFTAGVAILARNAAAADGAPWWKALFQTPILPAVALGLALKIFAVPLPMMVEFPLKLLGSAFIPIALFLLGATLADIRWRTGLGLLSLSVSLRMLAAPVLTWLSLIPFDIDPTMRNVLIVSASAPIGAMLAILSHEYRSNQELTAGSVFLSTMLSPLVATVAIYLVRLL